MRKSIEREIGKIYGELTVVGFDKETTKEKGRTFMFCQCECGNKSSIALNNLKRGTKTCGCYYIRLNERDVAGLINEKLTVLSIDYIKSKEKREVWVICECNCGNKNSVLLDNIKSGNTKSCGCNRGEFHGLTNHPMQPIWRKQMARCNNPKEPSYKNYGERGIECRWTIQEACEWYDNNPRPSLDYSLDRIDSNGHYELSNIRWSNIHIQNTNMDKVAKAKGVYKSHNKYVAEIKIDSKMNRKSFDNEEEAVEWRKEMFDYRAELYNKRNQEGLGGK